MTYIENVFVCIAAPLFITMLCVGRRYHAAFALCFAGMFVCLLSAYLNTFFTLYYQADTMNATTQIAPVVEEIVKLLPLLFFLIVFEPELQRFRLAALLVAASFATFENICYLAENGAGQIFFLLIRGFGTGAMHVACGSVYAEGLRYVWHDRLLRNVCIPGLLCVSIIYHAIYNLLVSVGGSVQVIGYCIPLLTMMGGFTLYHAVRGRQQRN